jgi:hypothetical protein
MKMVKLMPIICLKDANLLYIWKNLPIDCLVVRLQDLLCSNSFELNSTFSKIKEMGGIHNFLGFEGNIILSLIMKDDMIHSFTPEKYAFVIKALKPDYFTTVDGETYEKQEKLSLKEIKRCTLETLQLMRLCPDVKPIGQVKGCNRIMIKLHILLLKALGIRNFVFHIGDFKRNGSPDMISRAREYASIIRKHADTLFLYGAGSQKSITEFSFADAYISFNYFVKAYYGKKYVGTKERTYTGGYSPSIVRNNLIEMINNLSRIKSQTQLFEGGLCQWAAVQQDKPKLAAARLSR